MKVQPSLKIISRGIVISLGLMAFSFFINYQPPVKLISFAALTLVGFLASSRLTSRDDLITVFGEIRAIKMIIVFIITGALTGSILALLYRRHLGIGLFPDSVHFFVIISSLIGITEEVVFRGFLQGYTARINVPLSIIFGTLSHTGYKCFLFLSPAISNQIDILFLAIVTFFAGLLFGILKHLTHSLIPAMTAHAIFDILVYAGYVSAPWWVW